MGVYVVSSTSIERLVYVYFGLCVHRLSNRVSHVFDYNHFSGVENKLQLSFKSSMNDCI